MTMNDTGLISDARSWVNVVSDDPWRNQPWPRQVYYDPSNGKLLDIRVDGPAPEVLEIALFSRTCAVSGHETVASYEIGPRNGDKRFMTVSKEDAYYAQS